MSIKVICPNGHVLKVSNDCAGKSGLCPVCKVRVKVPQPAKEQLSEDAIMSILGPYDPSRSQKLAAIKAPDSLQGKPSPEVEAKVDAPSPPKKSCPHCNREVAAAIHICPHCKKYIAGLDDF